MKWLSNWFQEQVKQAMKREQSEKITFNVPDRLSLNTIVGATSSGRSRLNQDNSITFNLYRATGGVVIELTEYDSNTDRTHRGLHVIPSTADLGAELTKIITFENLKR